jgi:hypothetical protein
MQMNLRSTASPRIQRRHYKILFTGLENGPSLTRVRTYFPPKRATCLKRSQKKKQSSLLTHFLGQKFGRSSRWAACG